MKLRTLGLTVLTLAPVGIALVTPVASMAQTQVYYHVGAWDAFSGRNQNGGAVCGVGNTNPTGSRRLSIGFDIGGTDTAFTASKPDWSIPENTQVRVVMQIGLNTPWTVQATGHENSIEWSLDRNGMVPFDQQFRSATSMTLTFPDGNEPPWTVPLTGSAAIADAFSRCVRDLTRQVQAAQPPTAVTPASPGPTQPFAVPAGQPPAAPPAAR
jgi:hypothetical protein